MEAGSGDLDRAAIRDVIEHHPVELAVLFGSHARGDSSVESDIDIAVAYDETIGRDDRLSARIDLIVDLSAGLGTDDVDVADLASIDPAVGEHALRTGILLVGDEPSRQEYLERFRGDRPSSSTDHKERVDRLNAILDRLEAKL